MEVSICCVKPLLQSILSVCWFILLSVDSLRGAEWYSPGIAGQDFKF